MTEKVMDRVSRGVKEGLGVKDFAEAVRVREGVGVRSRVPEALGVPEGREGVRVSIEVGLGGVPLHVGLAVWESEGGLGVGLGGEGLGVGLPDLETEAGEGVHVLERLIVRLKVKVKDIDRVTVSGCVRVDTVRERE